MNADDPMAPERFDERFTVYTNVVGNPVQRSLREMTEGEVVCAVQRSLGAVMRLKVNAEPYRRIVNAIESDTLMTASNNDLELAGNLMRDLGEAEQKTGRLLRLVGETMPRWRRAGIVDELRQAVRAWM